MFARKIAFSGQNLFPCAHEFVNTSMRALTGGVRLVVFVLAAGRLGGYGRSRRPGCRARTAAVNKH